VGKIYFSLYSTKLTFDRTTSAERKGGLPGGKEYSRVPDRAVRGSSVPLLHLAELTSYLIERKGEKDRMESDGETKGAGRGSGA